VKQRGSHRQFKRASKPGKVTIAGPSAEAAPKTLRRIVIQGGLTMNFAVIYEKTSAGYSAYVPDLPGCIAGGSTLEETTGREPTTIAACVAVPV
jgi:hypothetical protein